MKQNKIVLGAIASAFLLLTIPVSSSCSQTQLFNKNESLIEHNKKPGDSFFQTIMEIGKGKDTQEIFEKFLELNQLRLFPYLNCDCYNADERGRFWKFPVICTILYLICVFFFYMWWITPYRDFIDELFEDILLPIADRLDCWWYPWDGF